MSKLRFRVVESAFEKKATELTTPAERPSEYYGELVFNREKMFKYLPERAYEKLVDYAISLGVMQAFIQEGDTAKESFIPPFTLEGV